MSSTAADEIVRIAVTVGVVQILCDGIAYWRVYSQIPYQRALERLSRSHFKWTQVRAKQQASAATTTASSTTATTTVKPTNDKRKKHVTQATTTPLQRAMDDHAEALGNVAQRHTSPNLMTSLVFVVLMRILGTEYQGRIVGLLPLVPWNIARRLVGRGLTFATQADEMWNTAALGETAVTSVAQAAGFTFIYLLVVSSVKFYVHQLLGTRPPHGAESFASLLDSPQGQQIMRAVGIDPKDLKPA
jgi:hypothetical protein